MSTGRQAQLPLDLGHRPALGREDFLIAPCNEVAAAMIDRWPAWTGHALVLQGSAACGKSHLAAVWRQKTQAREIPLQGLVEEDASALVAGHRAVLVEQADFMIGDPDAERALFHLFNMTRECGGYLLLTMRAAPRQLDFTLADLASRLRAAPLVCVGPPDETLLAALMVKMFADRQLAVPAEAIHYALPRMERSFAAARDLVERADSLALSEGRGITVPMMRRILLPD